MKKISIIYLLAFFAATSSGLAAEELKPVETAKSVEAPKPADEAKPEEEIKSGTGKFQAKDCYKRCMEEVDDKAACDYICYKKKS